VKAAATEAGDNATEGMADDWTDRPTPRMVPDRSARLK
jgi:hypothetical protein